jgi:hypothetical protein
MRVMVIVKANKESEAGILPKQNLLAEMGKFNEELVKAGVLLAADGLQPSSKGKRVRFSGDKRLVIDGPFAETKELIAGYWLWQVRSMEEAVEWVKRCPCPHEVDSRAQEARGTNARRGGCKEALVSGEESSYTVSILRTVVRRIDGAQIRSVETVRTLGSPTKTDKGEITMRFMMIVKHTEKQGPPPKSLMDAIAKAVEEETKAGTMLGNGGLLPTAQGARVRLSGGKVTVIDGPFTEAKEIIGGYAQFELKSKEEAIESAVQFMELHKKHWPGWEGETEVRQMFGPDDFPCKPA